MNGLTGLSTLVYNQPEESHLGLGKILMCCRGCASRQPRSLVGRGLMLPQFGVEATGTCPTPSNETAAEADPVAQGPLVRDWRNAILRSAALNPHWIPPFDKWTSD